MAFTMITEIWIKISILGCYILFMLPKLTEQDWCDLDTGEQTIVDGRKDPHNVHISITRDGSVWIRLGYDHKDLDWAHYHEHTYKFQDELLSQDMMGMIETLDYSEFCVLTDMDFVLRAEGGWHPSFILGFFPQTKRSKVLKFRKNKDCYTETNLTTSRDKQSILCDGGKTNACGLMNLPPKGQSTPTMFIKGFRFDPVGPDSWTCPAFKDRNYYSLSGSFYHVYIKLASCPKPKDSRVMGFEAKLRSRQDADNITNTVIIPDPTQIALAKSVIDRWQIFVKIISPQHKVYLQVWRPSRLHDNTYTLIDQTFTHPNELRFQEILLQKSHKIHVAKGDVIGLYFPIQNPIGWSKVPCAGYQQHFRTLNPLKGLQKGDTFTFNPAEVYDDAPCRHYSFTAVFANKTGAKLVEDWLCPSMSSQSDGRNNREHNPYDKDSRAPKRNFPNEDKNKKDLEIQVSPIYLLLGVIGSLTLLLLIVGFISYYKAISTL